MVDKTNPKTFTVDYGSSVSVLETQCGICETYNPLHSVHFQPDILNCKAIWDTGAMSSVISTHIVNLLNLRPSGKARIFHANGESVVNTYFVNILLPNNVVFTSLRVTEGLLSDTDVLIGMDIISRGDFSVTQYQEKTKFSFQIPSTHDIDFVKEYILL